jgi:phage shock protein A
MSILLRSFNVFRGMLGTVVLWFERRNPDALLENEKENLHKLIQQFNAGLVSHAALSERLSVQVQRGERQLETFRYRINALLSAGERDAAAREALSLKEAGAQLEEDRRQLDAAEETYARLIRRRDEAISESRSRIEQVRRQIGDLKVKRAIADLEGMARAMIGEVDSRGASLSRLEEMVGEERGKAAARARVAQAEPGLLHPGAAEAVRSAMASTALDEFLSTSQGGSRPVTGLLLPAPEEMPVARPGKQQN